MRIVNGEFYLPTLLGMQSFANHIQPKFHEIRIVVFRISQGVFGPENDGPLPLSFMPSPVAIVRLRHKICVLRLAINRCFL